MSARRRGVVWAALVLVLAPALSKAVARDESGGDIIIGLLLPPSETEATNIRLGAELGVEAANRVPGAKLRLMVRGSAGQWGTEGDDAVVLALDQGAQALIAPTSGTAVHQALQVAGRTRVPVVSLCGDGSVTGAGVPWAVRLAPSTRQEAAALFAALRQPGHSRRVTVFVPPDRAGREAGQDLQTAAREAAVEIGKVVELPSRDPDYTDLANGAREPEPEAILLWVDSMPAGALAKALRAAGFKGRLAGPSRLASAGFSEAAGKAEEGFLLTSPVPDERSAALRDRFFQDYRRRAQPSMSVAQGKPAFTTALAFDAVQLLAEVLRRAGEEPAFRAFPLTGSVPGVTGELAFDRYGDRRVQLQVLEHHEGQWRPFTLAGQR